MWQRALIGICLLLSAFLIIGVLRGGGPSSTHNPVSGVATLSAPLPDIRVQAVHLLEQTDVAKGLELFAEEAELYDAKKRVIVRQLQAQLPANAAAPLHVTADQGEIDRTSGNVLLRGRVRLQYLEGYTVETDLLYWNAVLRSVQTDQAVQIDNALAHITGRGLYGDVAAQRFVLQDDVRASFRLH